MKRIYLIIATMFSLSLHADLKEEARQERSWRPLDIHISSMPAAAATGYLTSAGTWRIDQIAPDLEVRTDLISAYASGLGLAQFTKHCGRMGYGFAAVRELNRTHEIKLSLPEWETAVDRIKGPQPMRVLRARSKVAFEASSNTLRYANIDPHQLERSVETQVQNQMDGLRADGSVDIDIAGHDYMACDFVTGQMHIGVEVVWEYPSAKLKRTPALNPQDLTKTIEQAKAGFSGGRNCGENLVLASAIFATSLNSVTTKKIADIGPSTYLAAFNAVYDHPACQWREDRLINAKDIVQEFDLLSEARSQAPVRVLSRFSGVIR